MHRLLLITLILLFIAACNPDNPPKNQIHQDDLVPILIDLHLVYSIQTSREFKQLSREFDSIDTYSYLFEKHGVEKATFDSTIAWYSRHPVQFMEVYDEVIMQLTQRHDSISPNI